MGSPRARTRQDQVLMDLLKNVCSQGVSSNTLWELEVYKVKEVSSPCVALRSIFLPIFFAGYVVCLLPPLLVHPQCRQEMQIRFALYGPSNHVARKSRTLHKLHLWLKIRSTSMILLQNEISWISCSEAAHLLDYLWRWNFINEPNRFYKSRMCWHVQPRGKGWRQAVA